MIKHLVLITVLIAAGFVFFSITSRELAAMQETRAEVLQSQQQPLRYND